VKLLIKILVAVIINVFGGSLGGKNKMNIEKQVTNLGLSKELKENGYPQEGLWFYNSETMKLQRGFTSHTTQEGIMKWSIVAPTCAELGEKIKEFPQPVYCIDRNSWVVDAVPLSKDNEVLLCEDTEVDARAQMVLFLIKKGLLK